MNTFLDLCMKMVSRWIHCHALPEYKMVCTVCNLPVNTLLCASQKQTVIIIWGIRFYDLPMNTWLWSSHEHAFMISPCRWYHHEHTVMISTRTHFYDSHENTVMISTWKHYYDLIMDKQLWSLHEITVITSHYRTVLISPRTHCCDLLIIILFWSSHEPTIMIRHDHTVMISSWRISRIVELHMHCAEDSVNYFKTYSKYGYSFLRSPDRFTKSK